MEHSAPRGELDTTLFGAHDLAAPLVGRVAELQGLQAEYGVVLSGGECRTVTLLGENGSGKSRLIHEFVRQVRNGPLKVPRVYRGRAQRRGNESDSASGEASYGVFARLLRARFGLVEGISQEQAQLQVRDQVSTALGDRKVGDVCYFLGQLIDLTFDESPLTEAVASDPLQARPILRALTRRFFEGDASHGPVCLVFDDLHHADDDSIDLLRFLIQHLQAKMLVICAGRHELLRQVEGWHKIGDERHSLVELRTLSKEDSARAMNALLAPCEGAAPQALIDAGVNAASGNPGQLYQMVRAFHDSGVLAEKDALAVKPIWRVDLKRLHSVRLPVTVEDAVGIRVSSLTSKERLLLEHAAAMGNVFWLGGLIALGRMGLSPPEIWNVSDISGTSELQETLQALLQRDYIVQLEGAAFGNETEYVFKQNLEREKIAGLNIRVREQIVQNGPRGAGPLD
jgi:predicted ATPase